MSAISVYRPPESVWWEYISGPSRLVRETVNLLQSGISVCICTHNNFPFRDTFFQQVANKIRETEHSLLLDDVILATGDPGILLIDRFGLKSEYRESIKPTDFLLKRRALANYLIPVVAVGDDVDMWLDFINSYQAGSIVDGLFILEVNTDSRVREFKKIQTIRYTDFVTDYDALLFAGLITDDNLSNTSTKRYVTAMVTSFFGGDAEGITSFINQYQTTREPIDCLPENVLPIDNLKYRLWNAQVQELFPLIMRETHDIIRMWRTQFDEAFEYIEDSRYYLNSLFPDGLRKMNHEAIESPNDLELASIYFLMRKKRRDKSGNDTLDYVLFIPDINVRERIELLYNMRNSIAHGRVCPIDEVMRLLNP